MKEIIKVAIVEGVKLAMTSENIGKFICGTYSDGTQRSLTDSLKGEYISPETKEKMYKKKYKKKKKKKKNKK